MLENHFFNRHGQRIPNPITVDWCKSIQDGDIDPAKMTAAILMVVAMGTSESKNAVNGFMNYISMFLQLEGTFNLVCPEYETVNEANVVLAEHLSRDKSIDDNRHRINHNNRG